MPLFTTPSGVLEGSSVMRLLRRIIAGSVICQRLLAAMRWVGRIEERILAGLRTEWSAEQEMQQFLAIAGDSRAARFLSQLILSAPRAAWHEASVRRLLDPMLKLERPDRIRLVGWMLVIAVLTHAVILAAFGISTDALGWSFRAAVGALGVFITWRPRAIGDAWDDRRRRAADPAPTSTDPS